MSLFEELQDLMMKHHFRPDKKLSQFYCINEALLQYLVNEAKLASGDVVVEVGPGTGFLTKKLIEKAKKVGAKVVAIDFDEKMFDLLNEEFAQDILSGVLKIIHGNALEQDFEALGANKVVCLPPYHISSELVSKIALTKGIVLALLVLDRGFVEKLVAFEGLSEYVALTAFINLNSKVEVLEQNISSQSFFPAPNCTSSIVKMNFSAENNSKEYFTFFKELFRHKNKDLGRGLKQALVFLKGELGWDEKECLTKIESLVNSNRKIYSLAPKELLEVYLELIAKKVVKSEKKIVKK